jgi:uncharacterized membrane protein
MNFYGANSQNKDLKTWVWAGYGLQFLTLLTSGLALLIAVFLAYFKFDESIGSMEESHFRWQIKTFWIGLAATIAGMILLMVYIGKPVLLLTQLWIAYRVVKGVYYLYNNKSINNNGFF